MAEQCPGPVRTPYYDPGNQPPWDTLDHRDPQFNKNLNTYVNLAWAPSLVDFCIHGCQYSHPITEEDIKRAG